LFTKIAGKNPTH